MPDKALKSVIAKGNLGVYASMDILFKGAVFGRDSLEVAEDLMQFKPKLAKRILLAMCSLQGEVENSESEEEPGKIIHEYRTSVVNGRPLDGVQREIFEQLTQRWGGSETTLAYYGSVDSTPLFIRTLITYCHFYGKDILNEPVKLRSGQRVLVMDCLGRALDWLLAKLQISLSGLLEYKRLNQHGIENQVWKDSQEFYVHNGGHGANHELPIASIEVQALAYDALVLASDFLPNSTHLRAIANVLRDKTIDLLWLPKRSYFALGFDYSTERKRRIMDVLTANPAEMLDSMFFDDIDSAHKQAYISAIIDVVMSPEFLTSAGVRSRALSEAHLVNHWDYHGSFTSWPKETYDIAKGLRRQGFPKLAEQLDNRLYNVVRASKSYPEFIYVDANGRVLGIAGPASTHGELVFVNSTNKPERIQAWTVSAFLAISRSKKRSNKSGQAVWQHQLEDSILESMLKVERIKSNKQLVVSYPPHPYELQSKDNK